MFVQMSGALLPSFSLFCPAIAQPLAEMLMQLVPIDVISQGDRRPLLHHCPGIAIRLTPSKPRKRSPGGDDCSRDRPVRSSEVATTSRMKRTSATFDERSWAPSAAPMSMGPKADSADLQPVASAKSPIRPDHSHWLPGAYSQKLGGKFAQRFCDATVKVELVRTLVVPLRPPEVPSLTEGPSRWLIFVARITSVRSHSAISEFKEARVGVDVGTVRRSSHRYLRFRTLSRCQC